MTPKEVFEKSGMYLISGRQVNPDGSVTTSSSNPSRDGHVITPAPSQSDEQLQISSQYGLGDLYKYMGGAYSQLTDWLSRTDVPEDRKKAVITSLVSKINSLPEHSGLDLLSEQVIGTSNYQKNMQKLSGELGKTLSEMINTNYEEKYDSAPEAESRLRQSGTNPDIQSHLESGTSADVNEMSEPYQGLDTSDSSSVASTMVSVIQGVFGYISAIQGIVRNGIDLEDMQTSQISNENSLVRDMVLSSGFVPDSAISFDANTEYPDSDGKMYKFIDDDGKPIPYSRLSKGHKSALKNLVDANGFSNVQLIENLFKGSGFSRNKINRLKGRVYDYLSSERFLSDWYGQYSSHMSNKLSGNVDSESIFMKVFDNLFSGVSNALSKSDYYTTLSKNAFDKETYDELLKAGVPKEEAEQRARVAQRDKADNLVFDEFRSQMLKVLDDSSPEGKKADKWDKLGARIGLVLLYLARQKMK